MNCDVAVITGNGFSVGCDNRFNLSELTERYIRSLDKPDSSTPGVLLDIAERIGSKEVFDSGDFEVILGKLGDIEYAFDIICDSIPNNENDSDSNEFSAIKKQMNLVRSRGIGTILNMIAQTTVNSSDDSKKTCQEIIASIVDTYRNRIRDDANIAFCTLNYDTLLQGALVKLYDRELEDLAFGNRTSNAIESLTGARKVRVGRQKIDDFIGWNQRHIRYLQLHGGVNLWRKPRDSSEYFKIDVNEVRSLRLLSGKDEYEPTLEPCVVMGSQFDKNRQIEMNPHKIAYEATGEALGQASHWLLIGYSYRDSCVNDLLRRSARVNKSVPNVHIVDFWPHKDEESEYNESERRNFKSSLKRNFQEVIDVDYTEITQTLTVSLDGAQKWNNSLIL